MYPRQPAKRLQRQINCLWTLSRCNLRPTVSRCQKQDQFSRQRTRPAHLLLGFILHSPGNWGDHLVDPGFQTKKNKHLSPYDRNGFFSWDRALTRLSEHLTPARTLGDGAPSLPRKSFPSFQRDGSRTLKDPRERQQGETGDLLILLVNRYPYISKGREEFRIAVSKVLML